LVARRVSEAKTVRWIVFASGVAQSKEREVRGTTRSSGDYATATGRKKNPEVATTISYRGVEQFGSSSGS
jgi:hypothetical protein